MKSLPRVPAWPAAALAATLLAGAAQAQTLWMAPEALYRKLAPSVWLVRVYDADGLAVGTGSAVVTAPETLLTNCHVLAKAKRFVVRNDNVQHDARLQHIDVERDLCQITARNLRAPAVELADSDQLTVGQKVYALGNPRGLELTLSDGIVSALRRTEDHRSLAMIQTSAPISPGSSGGGLFDAGGRLIGITTLQLKESQNLNFAIPINWQRDLAARSDNALRAARIPVAGTGGTPAPAPAPSPQPAQPGAFADAEAVPGNEACRTEYAKYVAAPQPKAFAVHQSRRCIWQQSTRPNRPQISASPDPSVRAMEICVSWWGAGCSLYAVDSKVVYQR